MIELRNRDLVSEEEFRAVQLQIRQESEDQRAALIQRRALLEAEAAQSISDSFLLSLKAQRASANETGKILANLAVRGYGKAFASIGKALASGENANQAFVDSVKATASEAASAFGDYYIKLGIARIAEGDPRGPALVAGGGALKVLAGALGASGDTVGGGSSGGGGGAPTSLTDTSALEEQDIERTEPQSQFVVNVQGDIFDTDSTGERLAEIFSEAGAKKGILVTDTRFS